MKTLKIVLFVISLLSVGFIAGFYTHRYVVAKKIEKVAELRFAMGFKKNLFEVIHADQEQRDEMGPVVDKYAQEIARVSRESRMRRKELVDSLYKELKPMMSEEQVTQMEEFSRRFRQKERERRDDFRKRRPPMEKSPQ